MTYFALFAALTLALRVKRELIAGEVVFFDQFRLP